MRRLDSVHPAHEDVHQDDLRVTGDGEVDRLLPARRLADHLDAIVALEEHRQGVREQPVVVHDEHADGLIRSGLGRRHVLRTARNV